MEENPYILKTKTVRFPDIEAASKFEKQLLMSSYQSDIDRNEMAKSLNWQSKKIQYMGNTQTTHAESLQTIHNRHKKEDKTEANILIILKCLLGVATSIFVVIVSDAITMHCGWH